MIARASLIAVLLGLTSCASTPVIYSDSPSVSRADIDTAIQLVQQRCAGKVVALFQYSEWTLTGLIAFSCIAVHITAWPTQQGHCSFS